jgi:hypothetical protein
MMDSLFGSLDSMALLMQFLAKTSHSTRCASLCCSRKKIQRTEVASRMNS